MNFAPYSIAAMLWPEKLGLERAKDMTRRPAKEGDVAEGVRLHGGAWTGELPVRSLPYSLELKVEP